MDVTLRCDIRQFIIHNFLFGEGDDLKDHESFLDKGIIDSTGVLELVGYIERQFEISVADQELVPENLDSVERVAGFVELKQKAKAPVAG